MGLELRPLPSTGVTRRQRYYEPLRHPGRPGLSLAGVRLRVTRPHRLGFPVFRWISVYRHAVVITPVARWVGSLMGRPIPAVSLLASGCGLPRLVAGSASTLVVSRPAQRSLALRPACSPHGQKPRVYLEGSDGFVASTAAPIATGWSDPFAGWESHPLKILDFSRRTTRIGPRWLLVCCCGRECRRLYVPSGVPVPPGFAAPWACRKCWRLAYRTRRRADAYGARRRLAEVRSLKADVANLERIILLTIAECRRPAGRVE